MKIGTSQLVPLLGPDHVVPRHQKNEGATTGLNVDSTHFTSARNYTELDRLGLPPSRQSDVYGHLFGAGAKDNADARTRVRLGHDELMRRLGGGSEASSSRACQVHQDRFDHMGKAAQQGNAIHGNLESIWNRGRITKLAVTNTLQGWALSGAMPEVEVGLKVRVGREAGSEMSLAGVIPEFGQWDPVAAFVGGLVVKKGFNLVHDFVQPTYATGIGARRHEMGALAETFRANAEQASQMRAGSAGAGIVRAYGEHGRDHLEDMMRTTDSSVHDYMKAMQRGTRWAMEPDQHLAETGVVSAAIHANLARLAEADFLTRFAGRSPGTQPTVYYWKPPELPQTGYLSAATDPLTGTVPPGARARNDVPEAERPPRWDYRAGSGPLLAEVAKALKDIPSWGDFALAQKNLLLAKAGQCAGLVKLGEMCEDGHLGIAQGSASRRMAEQLYDGPARQGDKQAQYRLGRMLASEGAAGPAGSPVDLQAAQWLCKAAMQDHLQACAELGLMHAANRTGLDEHTSGLQACVWLRKAAALGSPEVLFTLGHVHERHLGDAGHADEANANAAKWYHEAAQRGHMEACLRLGLMHHRRTPGLPGGGNDADAAKYLGMAMDLGSAEAAYVRAAMYDQHRAHPEGDTPRKDAMRACLEQAADAGHLKARALLGRMLASGDLDPPYGESAGQAAARWLLLAARAGDVDAQCDLADLYRQKKAQPEGQQGRTAAAVHWYKAAADSGSERAKQTLREMRRAHVARHSAEGEPSTSAG